MNKIKNRYQAMKTRLAKDWWTATFGDPISWLILSFIGDWKWITPSRITVLSFFIRIGGAIMIALGNSMTVILGVVLIQIGLVMDHMDGNLARYRKTTTLTGGFMDRVFDGASFFVIISALGWYSIKQGSPVYILLIACLSGAFYLLICYIYWSYAYYELKEKGETTSVNPGAIEKNIKDIPTWKIILNGQKLLFKFHHIDYYFWISLSILIQKPEWGVWLHFIGIGFNLQKRFRHRLRSISSFG